MKPGIDFSQPSTIRGLVWVAGGILATGCLLFGTIEKAMAAMSIAGAVAGGLGVAVKD